MSRGWTKPDAMRGIRSQHRSPTRCRASPLSRAEISPQAVHPNSKRRSYERLLRPHIQSIGEEVDNAGPVVSSRPATDIGRDKCTR
jgi:hypothetical protein